MGEYYQSCPCIITNIDTSSTMKYILLLMISSIFALTQHQDKVKEIREKYQDKVKEIREKYQDEVKKIREKYQEIREKYQDEVKEIREKFANGEIDWDAGIYEFSDLPDEDFGKLGI